MTDKPRDALLERYADAVAHDTRRPSDRARNAARAHAQMLRDQAAVAQRAQVAAPPKPAANQPQWTISLVASLAVVGLAGLLYVQIDRGTPKDRDAAPGTAARTESSSASPAASPAPPARADTAQALPPERPALVTEERKPPAEKAVAAAPVASPPAAAVPPPKTAATTRKEAPPSPAAMPAPAPAPAQDAAQSMVNATTTRAYSASPAEADMAMKAINKSADQLANAGAMRDARSEASAESTARMAPTPKSAAAMAPATAAPAPGTLRRAREVEVGSPTVLFMEAVRTGHTGTMQKLLEQGVAVNTRDDNGNTALMLAVRHRQAAAVRKLLAMGADTTLVNSEGLTAPRLANQLGLADMAHLLQSPR